ncbi:hypothetical protein [Zymobacter sp. IVIA_5232.4 C2]|uniref:hypothetical protein n=1 Tax=Zymobacter sp. IVIA_5232.4 C2 TaxID=3394855 RepID=UPI0039C43FE4
MSFITEQRWEYAVLPAGSPTATTKIALVSADTKPSDRTSPPSGLVVGGWWLVVGGWWLVGE